MASGFANTDLDLHLERLGVQRAIVIGLRANTCIDSTVRFAAELGYDVTLVSDAIAGFSVDERRATIEINAPSYASAIVSTDALVGEPVSQPIATYDIPSGVSLAPQPSLES
jgi:ureidoacrylate peracid hydrolase